MTEPVDLAPPDTSRDRPRRAVVLLVLAVLLAAGVVADRAARPEPVERGAFGTDMPAAAPASALSSSWFCPGGTAAEGGAQPGGLAVVADTSVIIANPTTDVASGSVTIVPVEGDANTVPVTVEPRSRTVVRVAEVLAAPFAGVLVDLDRGAVVAEQQVAGPLGYDTSPCASSASDRSHIADGSTAREDRLVLTLFNPFPEDAIVDLSFAHEEGRAVPAAFQGLVVKGRRLLVVNAGDHVRRRATVAVTATARTGRFVLGSLQVRGGATPGLSLMLGAPSPGETWHFAEGLVADGITERYTVYNPTSREAQVTLELALDEGAAEPFDLTVPARDRVAVVANDEERIPRGVAHSATIRSLNGVPVVAQRTITAVAPAPRIGVSDALGIRRPAARWVLAAGATSDTIDEVLAVQNTTARTVTLSVMVLASGQPHRPPGLQRIELGPGRRQSIRMTDHISRPDLPLLVTASAPVIVERGIYLVGSPGLSISAGIPLR